MMLRAHSQLDWTFAVVAIFHEFVADALALTICALPFMPLNIAIMFVAHLFLTLKSQAPRPISGQQLAIHDVGDLNLAIRLEDCDVLVRWLAVGGVVLRVCGDAPPVRCTEMVDFSDKAPGIIECLHVLSPL